MSDPKIQSEVDPFDDGFVGTGRPLGAFLSPISDEDARRLEEAWNDLKFYELAKDDVGGVTAGYVPKPTVNADRSLVPTMEEIKKLPLLARVAFAARCARRVFPLLKHFGCNDLQADYRSLDTELSELEARAAHWCFPNAANVRLIALRREIQSSIESRHQAQIRLADSRKRFEELDVAAGQAYASVFETSPKADPRTDPAYASARAIQESVEAAREQCRILERECRLADAHFDRLRNSDRCANIVARDLQEQFPYAATIAFVVAHASRSWDEDDSGISAVRSAAAATVVSLARVTTVRRVGDLCRVAGDFDWVLRLAVQQQWTDDTPVPPSVFGPMWEGPPPEWWTYDVLAGLPPESATEVKPSTNGHPVPTQDEVAPR